MLEYHDVLCGLCDAMMCMKMTKENDHRCMSIYYEHVRIVLASYVCMYMLNDA